MIIEKSKKCKFIVLAIALGLLLILVSVGLITTQNTVCTHATNANYNNQMYNSFDIYTRGDYSINDIRHMLGLELQEYEEMRVHIPSGGVDSYYISIEEIFPNIEYLETNSIQPTSSYNFSMITGAGRNPANSIVVVVMGDGFNVHEQGTSFMPSASARGSFLYQAFWATQYMLNMHPFNLFADLFMVYAIHTISVDSGITYSHGINQRNRNTYFQVDYHDTNRVTMPSGRRNRARTLANQISNDHADMIQVIANTTRFGGTAWTSHHLTDPVLGISLTTVHTNHGHWHRTFVHEFGHSFGSLADERASVTGREAPNMTRANIPDASVRWSHWIGHSCVTYRSIGVYRTGHAPDGWAIPVPAWRCIMSGSGARITDFCRVCAEELTRRMGIVVGYMPGLNALSFRINSRTVGVVGQRTYSVSFINNNDFDVQVTYNQRMAYASGARELAGLSHLATVTVPRNGYINRNIRENIGATHITAGIRFVTGATSFLMVSYANGLTNNSSNPPSHNVINLGTIFFGAILMAGNTARITGSYCTAVGEIFIPQNLLGLQVCSIGTNAFAGQNGMTAVTIPASVTYVGAGAFADVTSLERVNLSNGLRHIGNRAFANTSITSIHIPSTVTSIGNSAFIASHLERITFGENSQLRYIWSYAFYLTRLRHIELPYSLRTIGSGVFARTNMRTIVATNPTPPTLLANVFSGINRALIQVNIPVDSSQTYLNAGWTGVGLIEPNSAVITINSETDLELIRANPWGNFRLGRHIHMTQIWQPIPMFFGHLDGNNFDIFNMRIYAREVSSNGNSYVGMFEQLEGSVSNLGIYDGWIMARPANHARIRVGMIAGRLGSGGSLHRVVVGRNRLYVNWTLADIGGMVGYVDGGRITNSGNYLGQSYSYGGIIGGIAGVNNGGQITDSHVMWPRLRVLRVNNNRLYIGIVVGFQINGTIANNSLYNGLITIYQGDRENTWLGTVTGSFVAGTITNNDRIGYVVLEYTQSGIDRRVAIFNEMN